MYYLSVAASWLSVGSSYQEPLVAINTEKGIKTVSLTANKNEISHNTDLESNSTVNLVSDNQENREKDYLRNDVKSEKKRKKYHRTDKKEKKNKNKKSRRNEDDYEDVGNVKKSEKNKKGEVDENRKMSSDKRVSRINNNLNNSSLNEDLHTRDNQNNNDDANVDVESDSGTDWSSDESVISVQKNNSYSTSHSTTSSTIKKSKNNNNNINNNNNQLVISNKNNIKETRDLIFLPDGKILLTEVKKTSGTGVSWVTDIRGDKSIKLHGVYTPDIPVYSLYTGDIDFQYRSDKNDRNNVKYDNNQIDNYTNSSKESYSSSKNNKYLNSISLAKRTHILPTGLIMSSENGPIFRPKEKTVLQHKFGKTEILREIRLKKKNRFYLAGKNQMVINGEEKEGSMKKKRVSVDVISDINLKRIRFENLKKRKNQQNTPNVKEIKIENENENENEMHFNTSGNLIVEKSNTKNRTLIPYSASNFLTSDFLPLPTQTISGIDTEFVSEDTDFKSVKTAETKRDHAAFFGFGNNSEFENLKNEIEVKVLEKKKETVKVFLSDSEVTISMNVILDFFIYAFLAIISIIVTIELITTINILFILM